MAEPDVPGVVRAALTELPIQFCAAYEAALSDSRCPHCGGSSPEAQKRCLLTLLQCSACREQAFRLLRGMAGLFGSSDYATLSDAELELLLNHEINGREGAA